MPVTLKALYWVLRSDVRELRPAFTDAEYYLKSSWWQCLREGDFGEFLEVFTDQLQFTHYSV